MGHTAKGDGMRRLLCLLMLALGMVGALAAGAPRSEAAPPAGTFSATLTDDGACHFTATANWLHLKVTEVDFTWSFGLATWQDDVTSFHGPKAVDTFTGGAADTARAWSVNAAFYAGARLLGSVTAYDSAACGLQL